MSNDTKLTHGDKLAFSLVIMFIFAGLFSLFYYIINPLIFPSDTYTGKEIFNTEQEYQVFKEALVDDDVDIKEITILHSDPPIIVNMRINVPRDTKFGYGKFNESLSTKLDILVSAASSILIIAILALATTFISVQREKG